MTLRDACIDNGLAITVYADDLLPFTHHTDAALEPTATRTPDISGGS